MVSQMKLEATEMWSYRRMLGIPWIKHVSNEKVLKKKKKKKKGHILNPRKGGLENYTCKTD